MTDAARGAGHDQLFDALGNRPLPVLLLMALHVAGSVGLGWLCWTQARTPARAANCGLNRR